MAVLLVKNLRKTFTSRKFFFGKKKRFTAVNDISFDLQEGEILGLLGANGAGKTTTIQMLLGTLTPTSGSITYFGKNFFLHAKTILQHVCAASGYDKMPATLTVWDNLDIFGRIYGIDAKERRARITDLLKRFDMWKMRDKRAGTLSAGESTRLILTKAFLPHPKIVLLDEPTAALDPDIAQQVRQFILKQKHESAVSILLTSHNMDEVTEVCDRVLVMKMGNIIADSTPEQLTATITKAHVHLFITEGLNKLLMLVKEQGLSYELYEHTIEIELDEQDIASFLTTLAQNKIVYSQISIDKATLEDYFISLAQNRNTS